MFSIVMIKLIVNVVCKQQSVGYDCTNQEIIIWFSELSEITT